MRWFVAVEVPSTELRALLPIAATAPAHLTIRFLGEVPADRTEAVRVALSEAASAFPAFAFELRGVGAFPSGERPRVVWVGVGRGAEEFLHLAERTNAALEEHGIPRERWPFVPHVTLFRVRGHADAERAKELRRAHETTAFGSAIASEIRLYDSQLSRSGAIHTVVSAFPLGTATSGN